MIFDNADGILDLRDTDAYKSGHLKNATWMGWEVLPERLNALPSTPASLFLVGPEEHIEAASMLLDSKGYRVAGSLVVNSESQMREWTERFPDLLETGNTSKVLWKPSALVAELVDSLAEGRLSLPCDDTRPAVLDIGCGGGRDAVFLAKQRMNVVAIDNEINVLKRSKALAAMSGAHVKFKCCDIKKNNCLPDTRFDLILMVRFLNRQSFSYIKQNLKSGGIVVVQTFVNGFGELHSPKNPNFILEKGELAEVFGDFDIMIDRIDKLDDGRAVNSFVAIKK